MKIKLIDLMDNNNLKGNIEQRATGCTPQMHAYCRRMGLDDIPDSNIVWRKPDRNAQFRK